MPKATPSAPRRHSNVGSADVATNALAPRPQNALARQADPLQSLLKEAASYPQYGELVGYLSSRRMMPPIQQKFGYPSSFASNVFGNTLPETGALTLSASAQPSTLVHELTHAADRQIELQVRELRNKKRNAELTPLEQQFLSAYEKLVYRPGTFLSDPKHTRPEVAAKIDPNWTRQNARYRSTSGELAAFGMGSSVAPDVDNPAPLHVDPTYATEFSILLDMANRLQRSKPVTDKR
jgi:hypothetical protein